MTLTAILGFLAGFFTGLVIMFAAMRYMDGRMRRPQWTRDKSHES